MGRRTVVAVALLALVACKPDDEAGEDGGDDVAMFDPMKGGDGETEGTGGPAMVPGAATDLCVDASSVGPGLHSGTLRTRQPDLDGACGLGGPDAFFFVDVPRRADVWLSAQGVGFTPRVGVLPATCAAIWDERTLLCTQGVGGWLLDVAAGSSLVVSVGIDADDPAIEVAPPAEGADVLDFQLEVKLRDVLEVGEACEPLSRGRCGAGTACLPADDGPAVCTVLAADTCATAQPVALDVGTNTIQIPRDAPHTDAHAHACGGARHPERVLALELPITHDPPTLTIHSDEPAVGFALRPETCDPQAELGCAIPPTGPATLSLEVPPSAARPLLLFVELPLVAPPEAPDAEAGEEPPITFTIDLVSPG